MIPLGVYCPGETFQPGELESDLPTLADLGFNAIWLTHKSAEETAAIAEAADRHGIRVVAALAELDGSVEWQRKRSAEQVEELSEATLAAWASSPAPLAWGMCDEPKSSYMGELDTYINRWWRVTPGAVTTVPSWAHLESASEIGCEFQAHFMYPFRHDGTSGYAVSPHQAWLQSCADNVRLNVEPWAIGQAFSNRDHYRAPTPFEVSWQAYSAIAVGCRGFFAFCWDRAGGVEGRVSLRREEMWAQRSTLTSALKRIAGWWPLLASATTVEWQQPVGGSGSIVTRYTTPKGRYVLVVAGPDQALSVPLKAWLIQDFDTGRLQAGFGKVTVTVPAGTGNLYRTLI